METTPIMKPIPPPANPKLCHPISVTQHIQRNDTVHDSRSNNNNGKNGSSSNSNVTTRAASKKSRVYYMYKFILETYFHSDSSSNLKSDDDRTTIILDVAGGRGDLSWLFNNIFPSSIQSFVLDPRPTNHSSLLKSVKFLEENKDIAIERSREGSEMFQPLAKLLPQLIQRRDNVVRHVDDLYEKGGHDKSDDVGSNGAKDGDRDKVVTSTKEETRTEKRGCYRDAGSLRMYMDTKLVNAIKCSIERNIMLQDTKEAKSSAVTTETLRMKRESEDITEFPEWEDYWNMTLQRIQKLNISSFTSSKSPVPSSIETLKLLTNTSLLVGFHPDQATESIIDLAILLRKPFIICPCCVFPSEFPNRTIVVPRQKANKASMKGNNNDNDGKQEEEKYKEEVEGASVRVRDYTTFLLYLKKKHPKIRQGTLDFPFTKTGRNIVLYTLPEDMI